MRRLAAEVHTPCTSGPIQILGKQSPSHLPPFPQTRRPGNLAGVPSCPVAQAAGASTCLTATSAFLPIESSIVSMASSDTIVAGEEDYELEAEGAATGASKEAQYTNPVFNDG